MKKRRIMWIHLKHPEYLLLMIAIFMGILFYVMDFPLSQREAGFTAYPVFHGESRADSGINLESNGKGRLAVIIDDFGQDRDGVSEMMEIPCHLTFAVMPFMEFSALDAENGHQKGYEIIVHLSMEPVKGKPEWLGPRPILSGMPGHEVEKIVRDAFEDIPHAVGANIHMGSKASSEEMVVSSILKVIKEKEMYFVDSLTSASSVALKLAKGLDVPCLERNVFLDGTKSKQHIRKQLQKAAELAMEKSWAVAIGHVGAEGGKVTAEVIREMLPEFEAMELEMVFVSELF